MPRALTAAFTLALLGCSSKNFSLSSAPPDGDLGAGGVADTGGTLGVGSSAVAGAEAGATAGGAGGGGAAATGGTTTGPGSGGKGGGVTAPGGSPGGAGKGGNGGTVALGGTTASPESSSKPGAGGTGGAAGTTRSGGTGGSGGVAATGGSTGGGGAGGSRGTVSAPPAGVIGNPDGHAAIPADAQLEDVSKPTTVVGTGTPASCTGDLFIAAVAKGGVITFNCGPDMATIRLSKPAKVFNDKGPKIVIDGGGKVTLSGENVTRILYMNTCDEKQVWTSSHCDNQETPQLSVQNLTFTNGYSKNEREYDCGGAIYASGGRLKVINSRFVNNVCADVGSDVAGGAIRAFQQYNGLPIYIVNSTFGGASGLGNVAPSGGALASIGVSWTILNSVISYNEAIGDGDIPASAGGDGGGNGGGISNDGNTMTLTIRGSILQSNKALSFGSAIFFVSNDHTGNIVIDSSTITNNIGGSWYPKYPQISHHEDTPIAVTNSTIK